MKPLLRIAGLQVAFPGEAGPVRVIDALDLAVDVLYAMANPEIRLR